MKRPNPLPCPWLWAALAPLLVVLGLLGLHSVVAVFALYHVGLCLVVPAVLALRAGLSWRTHVQNLGLVRGGVKIGLVLGALMALAPVAAFWLRPDLFPAAEQLRGVLATWGVDPGAMGVLLLFMGLVNGPAEELFWRGWLQGGQPRARGRNIGLVVLFSSYHVATTGALAPGIGGLALMLTGVVAAGAFWAWSRARWGSVWVALLSHGGATVGYMGVCWAILR